MSVVMSLNRRPFLINERLIRIICIFLCINAYSQNTPDFASPSSMTFDFVQRKSSDMLAEDLVSSGRMAFAAPDRIRWEYLAPYPSLFVMNGARVLVENADGRKIMDAKSAGAYSRVAGMIMPLVRGDFSAGKASGFKTEVTDGGGFWRVELVPVKSGARRLFRRVVAEIDKELGVAVKVTVDEGNGDTTVITCTNIVLDIKVDERLFEF